MCCFRVGQGTAILLAGGWTTLLRLGGVKGVWTKRRDWPVMLFGNQIALTLGGLGGYGIGKLWCAQILEARCVCPLLLHLLLLCSSRPED